MTEMIKRLYDLAVLTFTLQADERPSAVRCELEVAVEGQPRMLRRWTVGTEELRLPAYLDPEKCRGVGYSFNLPEKFLHQLREVVQGELDPGRPLWLRLSKPYGYLGLIPWEQHLIPALGVPVLRLPDFMVDPIRSRYTLDVLLCADDQRTRPESVAEQTELVIDRIVEGVSLPTTVHVFTNPAVHAWLLARYQRDRWQKVLLYDPGGAPTDSSGDGVGEPSSPTAIAPNLWLQWMRNELCGRSIDVIHFLVPGNLSSIQGGVVVSASPSEPGAGLQAVSVAAITRLAMQVGAWFCAFSSPLGNRSEMGLRLAADTVGQLRPGPVLHHELRLDQDGQALADAYRFLVAIEPTDPPVNPAAFLYCQPFQVITERRRHEFPPAASAVEAIEPSPEVRDLLAGAETPTWVSAVQRYVEQYQWRLQRWKNDPDGVGPPLELPAGVEQALRLIRDMVHRHADTPSYPPAGLHKSRVTDLGAMPVRAPFVDEVPEASAESDPATQLPEVDR